MAINDDQLKNWFTYHAPSVEQLPQYQMIRDAGYTLAKVIVDISPASADQAAAVQKVREAVMMANAAIAQWAMKSHSKRRKAMNRNFGGLAGVGKSC